MIKEILNKKLNKVTNLLQSFDDDNSISSLEKDLLLSYLRDLYEIVKDSSIIENHKHQQPTIKKVSDLNVETLPISTPNIPETKIIESTVVEHVIPIIPQSETVIVSSIIEETPIKTPENPPQKTIIMTASMSNEAINEIFKIEAGNDLSDKLSMSRLDDIRKGMGLNERLFTQKELFDDNSKHFNEVLDELNNKPSFEAAQEYLISNVISLYKWDSESKIKKAATFVKLVKRKFL